MYPYERVRLVLPYSGTWDVLYSTRTPGHWMYPYVRSTVVQYSRTPGHGMYCTRTPGHECTVWYPYSGTLDVSVRARTTSTPVLRDMGCTTVQYEYCTVPILRDIECIRTCVVVLLYSGTWDVPYSTRITPGHWMYRPYEQRARPRVRLVLPYSGTWDVLYSTRTPGHWMYPYVRSRSTPVLRDMGCTVPILRDMNVPYYTRTPGHWMYPYERVRLILPYSGTWDVLSYSTRTPGHGMYPYVRSSTPVLRDKGCTVR